MFTILSGSVVGHFIRALVMIAMVGGAALLHASTARAQTELEQQDMSCKRCSTITDSCYSGHYTGGAECGWWSPCEEIGTCIVT